MIEVLARDAGKLVADVCEQDESILEILHERFGTIWLGRADDGRFEVTWYGPPITPEETEYGGRWRCAKGETLRGALLAALSE